MQHGLPASRSGRRCNPEDRHRVSQPPSSTRGFERVSARVVADVDSGGRLLSMVENMAGYARSSGAMRDTVIDDVVGIVRRALEDGGYLAVSPQFVVTGQRR